ncbi:DEHA2B14256p [Debaryomyces hansenii CBS767]|uniref:DEHA2B14256p n=1 Tax=Debaryomyces hansenii (strain ATCC 36239 / CBS 767 / BCRC 21394 / JCM 1990 / NBRC 0083 / IGC 2968) TaxID=284592 RepID=B5RSW1_DEBHA|nr:DEHA2B14256p [Debaryomyces hansenii CBS767]CAR65498.1 DEHA2B14256p [Debaryomyces hansenii CBS767]|eukprot:XP_002770129.1 DEHA2B14256p [Debaryomyces hansenii CBS767]
MKTSQCTEVLEDRNSDKSQEGLKRRRARHRVLSTYSFN